jgi:HTH-type transcriptional regulator/antitoxin HipB
MSKQSITDQLRALRKQRGMTQKELAEKIGQTQQRVAEIESGEFSPSLDTLRPILKALGAELVLRDNREPKITAIPPKIDIKKIKKLLEE